MSFEQFCKGLALKNKEKLMDFILMDVDEVGKGLSFENKKKLLIVYGDEF